MVNTFEAAQHVSKDTLIQVNHGEPDQPLSQVWEDAGTLGEFWEANQFSFSFEEVEQITRALEHGLVYSGGGGAAGAWGLRVKP